MIRFVCECGTQLQAREEHAGLMVLCPACQRQQQVPQPPPTAVQPVEVIEPAPARASAHRGPPPIRDEPEQGEHRLRHRQPAAGSSGKATASLILGIVSLCGCSCLTGLPAILFGILSLLDISQAAGRLAGKGMAIFGIVLGSFGTLCVTPGAYFSYVKVQDAKARMVSSNNLKQMGLAMHNYAGTYNSALPQAAIRDKDGKPLLSWRVALLPYLEQQNLYNSFKLDEPWDSPNNKKLLAIMPKVYQLPGDDKTPPDHTHYQVFTGSGALFRPPPGYTIGNIPDGTSNTILVVIAEQAVPWTKPDDVPFDPSKPIRPLLSTYHRSIYLVLLADGSVRGLSRDISEKTLKLAITANDGEVLGSDW